jgi:GNAT superfamily N-acetyltransferase
MIRRDDLGFTYIPFQAEYAEQVLRLMDMASQDTISGMTEHGYSCPEEFLEEVRNSELGNDSVLITLHDHDPMGFSSQVVVYDDFYSDDERSLFGTSIYVDPDHRRQGVASNLLTELEALATKHGFSRIHARVKAENKAMLSLMAKQGWKARWSTVSIDLGNRDDLTRMQNELSKEKTGEAESLTLKVELTANKKHLRAPSKKPCTITYHRGHRDRVGQLTSLGYSQWALQAAKKGTYCVAAREDEILGVCISLEGRINHIVAGSPETGERLVWTSISQLPGEIEKISLECRDLQLAVALSSQGFAPSLLLLKAPIQKAPKIDKLASRARSTKWYIITKDIPTPSSQTNSSDNSPRRES